MAAARHWAGGGTPDLSEAAADAESWGLPADLVADLEQEEPGFPVWPQNMPIIHAFLSIANQWHLVPIGAGRIYWQGLDYVRASAGLGLAGISLSPLQWSWVRVMERAAASVLNGYRG